MTIARRYQRFLIGIADATPEMILRAEREKDVIITDSIQDRWDAPPVRGIKSIFCLIASNQNGEIKL